MIMSKFCNPIILDTALNIITKNAVEMSICSEEPKNATDAGSTYMLAVADMSSVSYTISDGEVSGRKITVTTNSPIPVLSTGTASHIAMFSKDVLYYVTQCVPLALTSTVNEVKIPNWNIELRDAI